MITRNDLRFIFLLIVLVLLFFFKILFLAHTFFIGDILRWFQPWTDFGAEGIQQGILYLWNPYLANGEPFVANIQTAMFYPLKVMFYLFPFLWAYKLYIVVHFILGGIFFYLFLKTFRFEPKACLLGSILFTFGGWLIVHLEYFSVIGSVIWFAGAWILWRKALETKKGIYFLLTGCMLVVQFYAGYTFIFYYTNFFMCLYMIWERRFPLRALWMWLGITGVIALQLLPTFELMQQSLRSSWTFQETSTWSLPPLFLIKFILPELFGKACLPIYFPQPFGIEYFGIRQYWLTTFYLGIFPLFFLAFGWRKKPRLYFWETVGIIALILSMTASFPWTRYYYRFMPFASNFTHPATFMFFFLVVLIVLISRGFHWFLNTEAREVLQRLRIIGIVLVCIWFTGYSVIMQKELLTGFIEKVLDYKLLDKQLQWVEIQFFRFMATGILGLGVFYLANRYRRKAAVWGVITNLGSWVMICFVIAELFIFGRDINPVVHDTFFTNALPNVAIVRRHLREGRIFVEPEMHITPWMINGTPEESYFSIRRGLHMNVAFPYHIPYVYEYGYLTIKPYRDLLLKVRECNPGSASPIIDMLGGKLILSYQELFHPKLDPVESDFIRLYENKNVLPYSWLVGKEQYLPSGEIISYLAGDKFTPGAEVVFAQEDSELIAAHVLPAEKNVAYITTRFTPNGFQSAVKTNSAGWLILNDIYYPGWLAYVDGKKTPIYKANYILKSLFISTGEHSVTWIYRPLPFYLGLFVTIVSIGIVNFIVFSEVFREGRR